MSEPASGQPGSGAVEPGAPGSWEIVERRGVYEGFFSLDVLHLRHRLFAGGWSPVLKRELFRTRRAAVILPYDPVRDVVVLVEQFRTGAVETGSSSWLLEACAGLTEPGESAEEVARRGIAISMDGRGRALDNAFVERLWRTVKYEEVYLQEYGDADEARASLRRYWRFYNRARKHQALRYRTPSELYFGTTGHVVVSRP